MSEAYEKRMLRVIDHIHDHPGSDLSLDALADVAALSRFHFHRVFRAVTGETVVQAVRRLRLGRAAHRLVRETHPVAEIAGQVGYPNRTSFDRAFRKAFGMTPLSFRQRGELRPFLSHRPPLQELPMPDVLIRAEPARRLAAMPHRGPYAEISRAFEKLGALAATRGLYPQATAMIGVYYDDPSAQPAATLRSHAGLAIPESLVLQPPLEEVRLPAGDYAVLIHKGPYAGLQASYDRLYGQWLPASGREPADSPVFEIYLNTPMDTAQEELLTEICLPLR
ncbi:AraC family transcriptional regulator [Paracoccaceae bacterium]